MYELEVVAGRWDAVFDQMDSEARRAFLKLLDRPQGERASLIGRIHQSEAGKQLAELLIDLEADPHLRQMVVLEIKRRSGS